MVHTLLCICVFLGILLRHFGVHDLQLSIVFRIFSFDFSSIYSLYFTESCDLQAMAGAKIGLFEAQPVPECRIVIDSYFISELIQYLQVFFNCSRMNVFVSLSDRLQ